LTEDIDEIYRRASALDSSRPSETLRRKVLDHAAALTAAPPRPAAPRARWRPAVFGTLAAAALAGLLIMPRVFNPHPPSESAQTLPQTPPPEAAAKSRAIAPADEPAADASRTGASGPKAAAQPGAAPQLGAAPRPGAAAATESARAASRPADRSATLRSAAETGDVRQLRALLGAQVRIDAPDARGRTALMLAALRGQAESVDLLLAQGADPNAADANGTTPLQAALAADQPAIVAALRRAGAR
jgi:hypothetical protein